MGTQDRDEKSDARSSTARIESLIGSLVYLLVTIGWLGVVFAIGALSERHFEAAGLGLVATALAWGLLTNAVARR